MPLFLKAIPLTFSTFWRYLILLPFLVIGAFLFSLLGIIPIVGFFVPGIVGAALTILGLRCALAARGHHNTLDNSKLLIFSFVFGLIFMIFGWLLSYTYAGIIIAADHFNLEIEPLGLLIGLFGVSYYWSSILLALLSPAAFAIAVMTVPMTAAAYAMTYRGGDIRAFYGFGTGIVSLLIVQGVWLIAGNLYSIVGEVWAVFGLLATTIWAFIQGEPLPWDLSLDPWTAFMSTLLMTLASSWFFATAVLAWEFKQKRAAARITGLNAASEVSSDDIRALRIKRNKDGRN